MEEYLLLEVVPRLDQRVFEAFKIFRRPYEFPKEDWPNAGDRIREFINTYLTKCSAVHDNKRKITSGMRQGTFHVVRLACSQVATKWKKVRGEMNTIYETEEKNTESDDFFEEEDNQLEHREVENNFARRMSDRPREVEVTPTNSADENALASNWVLLWLHLKMTCYIFWLCIEESIRSGRNTNSKPSTP
ncbi:hypothetical protein BDQ17DRAFT_1435368 [Cyathus striatus]|nr:hypothetical protein BDQ17DRAFT_1435368 [Cyathus striatus]